MVAAGDWGKTEREATGFLPLAHLGRRWSEEAARRRPAETGGAARGGGTAGPGRGLGAVLVVVELEGEVEGLFIKRNKRGASL